MFLIILNLKGLYRSDYSNLKGHLLTNYINNNDFINYKNTTIHGVLNTHDNIISNKIDDSDNYNNGSVVNRGVGIYKNVNINDYLTVK